MTVGYGLRSSKPGLEEQEHLLKILCIHGLDCQTARPGETLLPSPSAKASAVPYRDFCSGNRVRFARSRFSIPRSALWCTKRALLALKQSRSDKIGVAPQDRPRYDRRMAHRQRGKAQRVAHERAGSDLIREPRPSLAVWRVLCSEGECEMRYHGRRRLETPSAAF